MSIWALSDLHLAFSVPKKTMEAFGPSWKNYTQRISHHWHQHIRPEDLVLIPGDISWAMTLDEALIDLKWLAQLPGTKVILRGNHDYWWPSSAKLSLALPSSIHFIHNNALLWNDIAIGGSRLWDTHEYSFDSFVTFQENPRERIKSQEEILKEKEEGEKIFLRELGRLRQSLSQLAPTAHTRIAMTHYPPVGATLCPSRASHILEEYRIDYCVFGHLHNVTPNTLPFGTARGVKYLFASSDYCLFSPQKVL